MNKIIFRFPTSKRRKMEGLILIETALRLCMSASKIHEQTGVVTEEEMKLLTKAMEISNKASRKFGFRNFYEMDEFRKNFGEKELING